MAGAAAGGWWHLSLGKLHVELWVAVDGATVKPLVVGSGMPSTFSDPEEPSWREVSEVGMKGIVAGVVGAAAVIATGPHAQTLNFDDQVAGTPPAGWTCGSTGGGGPRWLVEADADAPSPPNLLRQSGSGPFPWCVKQGTSIADGAVEVKFKPLAGREDQAGGLVWRWKDGDNYYVARANALENNVSLYYTERGRRHTIVYVDAPVAARTWHSLRVEFLGTRIRVLLDGKAYIERADTRISGTGAVGVWTKADSVTAFDDFKYEVAP